VLLLTIGVALVNWVLVRGTAEPASA
jgi:hypothetical protein